MSWLVTKETNRLAESRLPTVFLQKNGKNTNCNLTKVEFKTPKLHEKGQKWISQGSHRNNFIHKLKNYYIMVKKSGNPLFWAILSAKWPNFDHLCEIFHQKQAFMRGLRRLKCKESEKHQFQAHNGLILNIFCKNRPIWV